MMEEPLIKRSDRGRILSKKGTVLFLEAEGESQSQLETREVKFKIFDFIFL
jgi:hypothetical protein